MLATSPTWRWCAGILMRNVAERLVPWAHHHRIIPSRFPPVSVFEDTADPSDLEAILELEGLTCDRLRDSAGDIQLVASADRVSGPGSTVVMAAFTHVGNTGRFNDESFRVYYASDSTQVAIAETRFHRERFMRMTDQPAMTLELREYVGEPTGYPFVDIRADAASRVLDPDPANYGAGQALARQHRGAGRWGILFPSVRQPGGECLAAFRPPAVGIPRQSKHFLYQWNGELIDEIREVGENLI